MAAAAEAAAGAQGWEGACFSRPVAAALEDVEDLRSCMPCHAGRSCERRGGQGRIQRACESLAHNECLALALLPSSPFFAPSFPVSSSLSPLPLSPCSPHSPPRACGPGVEPAGSPPISAASGATPPDPDPLSVSAARPPDESRWSEVKGRLCPIFLLPTHPHTCHPCLPPPSPAFPLLPCPPGQPASCSPR